MRIVFFYFKMIASVRCSRACEGCALNEQELRCALVTACFKRLTALAKSPACAFCSSEDEVWSASSFFVRRNKLKAARMKEGSFSDPIFAEASANGAKIFGSTSAKKGNIGTGQLAALEPNPEQQSPQGIARN